MTEWSHAVVGVRPTPGARVAVQLVLLVGTAAIVLRVPALAAVIAPFVAALALDLVARRPGVVEVGVDLPDGRVLEDDPVPVALRVRTDPATERAFHVVVRTSRELTVRGAMPVVRAGAPEPVVVETVARRWGIAGVEQVELGWRSPFGLLGGVAIARPVARPVRVLPATHRLRELLGPRTTGAWSGVRPAGTGGRGVEFADLRPFAPGDLPRDVNWRVTGRRREPWVTTRHPEHSTDIVLLLDAFDPRALDDVVRTAATVLDAHLVGRDRVGVLGLSGILRWVPPGGGERHRHRLIDLLLHTQAIHSWAVRGLATVPSAALPPGALVIAMTRLGPEMAEAVADLRARRRDVVVLDLTPAVERVATDVTGDLAERLVLLEREDARDRLRRLGATVVDVPAVGGLAQGLATAAAMRRSRAVAR